MPINLNDPFLYEDLSLILDAFEKAALRADDRRGYLVMANSPMSGMDKALEGSEKALNAVNTVNDKVEEKVSVLKDGIHKDVDLLELFGGEDNPVKNYVEECLNCDLRLTFDWQLKPLDLLGPISDLLGTINAALDQLEIQIDPFGKLNNFCITLNNLKTLCIPDLIAILMSLKLLLKSALGQALDIKIDWTVILGPILKAIVDAIAQLILQVTGVTMAPLDCAIAAMETFEQLERETVGLALGVKGFTEHASNVTGNAFTESSAWDASLRMRDIEWDNAEGSFEFPEAPDVGRFTASERLGRNSEPRTGTDFSFPQGFDLTRDMTLADALGDMNFQNATFTQRLILPMREAREFLLQLVRRILSAVDSLEGLVGGGMALQLNNISLLLFIKDMIAAVMTIIALFRANPNVLDWCKHLEDNPHLLEDQLSRRVGKVQIQSLGNNTLQLSRGPDIVQEIKTCVNARDEQQAELISQWIKDLNKSD